MIKHILTDINRAIGRIFGISISGISKKPNLICPWKKEVEFLKIMDRIREKTMIDEVRLYILYQLIKQASLLEGNAAELGVYKGGSAMLLSITLWNSDHDKILHLFDTFSGLPPLDPEKDVCKWDDFSDTSLEGVASFLKGCQNIKFHKGLFEGTLHSVQKEKFCFVHVDCDLYWSVRQCCEFFYPRMVGGGYNGV